MSDQKHNNDETPIPSRRGFMAAAAGAGAAYCLTGPELHAGENDTRKEADRIIARCGYRCDLCAARSDDPNVRQKMVDLWRKYWGHQTYTAENAHCDGCLSDGRLADKNCQVRPCVIEKNIPNCAHCDKAPCDKLRKLCSSPHFNWTRFGNVPEEDYNLAMRQFDNVPELMAIQKKLKKQGKTK